MKKNRVRKMALSRETLRGLDDLGSEDLRIAGGTTENTCFDTCYCRSARTCYWSECGCFTAYC